MRRFVTNVGLITSDGPFGPNIMAAEWTHHVSYAPSLIAICIAASDATAVNIDASQEFGVSLAAESQRSFCSVAGSCTGRETDKIAALRELGATFYPAWRIHVPMVSGAAMNAECKLHQVVELGDHLTLVGEVLEIAVDPSVRPLLAHNGQYWLVGDALPKPPQPELDRIRSVVASHRKA